MQILSINYKINKIILFWILIQLWYVYRKNKVSITHIYIYIIKIKISYCESEIVACIKNLSLFSIITALFEVLIMFFLIEQLVERGDSPF